MDFVNKSTHIFDSVPLEDVLAFYSNPSAFPEFEEKIFTDYATDPKYLEFCQAHFMYINLAQTSFKIYYKLTEYDFKSRGFEYKLGLNMDTKPFNPSGCCSGGGLYFCELENLHQFENYGNYLTPIVVPYDIPVYKETHSNNCKHPPNTYEKLKAPCIYVLPRMRIDNPEVNKFISQASTLNNRFINCLLYKSDKIQDLKDFETYTLGKMFWRRERHNISTKLTIQQYLNSSDPELKMRLMKTFFNNEFIFDKTVVNFLIEHAIPYLIESNLQKIIPINCLTFTDKFSNCFSDLEKWILSECDVIAAGSSVLTRITDKNFKPNDIDLYISSDKMEHLVESGVFKISDYNHITMKNNYNMKNIVKVVDIKTNTKILDQYGFEKTCSKKYQLIVVDTHPLEFIKANFDFDLCTIGYSFAAQSFINIIDKSDYSVLTIQPSYINKMCGTETDSYSEYRAKKTFTRIGKYLSRGFFIENWLEFLEEIRDTMCK